MNAAGYLLGQLIGLGLVPAAVVWVLRGTEPGRVVSRAVGDAVTWPARRRARTRAAARHTLFEAWRRNMWWWSQECDASAPGTSRHEAAVDMVRYFQLHAPAPCYCPTCLNRSY